MFVLFLCKHLRQDSQTANLPVKHQTSQAKYQHLALQRKTICYALSSSTGRHLTLKLPFWESFGGWCWCFELLPFCHERFFLILMFRHRPTCPTFTPPPRHAKVLQHRLQDLFRSPSTMDHIIDLGIWWTQSGARSFAKRQVPSFKKCLEFRSAYWIKAKAKAAAHFQAVRWSRAVQHWWF